MSNLRFVKNLFFPSIVDLTGLSTPCNLTTMQLSVNENFATVEGNPFENQVIVSDPEESESEVEDDSDEMSRYTTDQFCFKKPI